jgi:Rrf2 family protein
MQSVLRISQAASLALHTMAFLAENPERQISTKEIASTLRRSEFHLAKVLQRLTRAGLVTSVRGPRGGFMLRDGWEELTLLEIYEAIEGPLPPGHCIAGERICNREQCLMGGLVRNVTQQVADYLSQTRLGQVAVSCAAGLDQGSSNDGDGET